MILDQIMKETRKRMERDKCREAEVRRIAEEMAEGEKTSFLFEESLKQSGISLICEVKKASPSIGLITTDFDYIRIAKEYEEAGAAAVSVLTEPVFFQGSISYLSEISSMVHIPVLRKDFVIDASQIYEAKAKGASAILLICAVIEDEQLHDYIRICDRLHLSALVEVHDSNEVSRAIQAGARVIGVNNRNLQDFTVDISNSIQLRRLIPKDIIVVAESGIKKREDVRMLEESGVNAMLIGETMMRALDKKKAVMELMTD